MQLTATSKIGTGILVRDVETAGIKFRDFPTTFTPALSVDVPYIMDITENGTAKWLLTREGSGTSATVLFKDLTDVTDPIADGWTTDSSRRWKTKIKPIEEPMEKVQRLRGVSFKRISNGKPDIGLIAE